MAMNLLNLAGFGFQIKQEESWRDVTHLILQVETSPNQNIIWHRKFKIGYFNFFKSKIII